jgi:hypothetical protein
MPTNVGKLWAVDPVGLRVFGRERKENSRRNQKFSIERKENSRREVSG